MRRVSRQLVGESKKYIFTSYIYEPKELNNIHEIFKVRFHSGKKEEILASSLVFPMSEHPMPCYRFEFSSVKNMYEYERNFYSYSEDFVHARNSLQDYFRNKDELDLIVFDHGYDFPPFPGGRVVFFKEKENQFIEDGSFLNCPSAFTFGGCSGDWDNDGFPELMIFNLDAKVGHSLFFANDQGSKLVPAGNRLPEFLNNRTFVPLAGTKFRDAKNCLHMALGSLGNGANYVSDIVLMNDGMGNFRDENIRHLPKRRRGDDWCCIDMKAVNFCGAFKQEGILAVYHDAKVQNGYIELYMQNEDLEFSFFEQELPLFETKDAWIARAELVKISHESEGFDGILILKHRGLVNFVPTETYVSLLFFDKKRNKFIDISEELSPLKGQEFRGFVEIGSSEDKASSFVFIDSHGCQYFCHNKRSL